MNGAGERKSGIRRHGWGGRQDQGMVKGMTREDERKEKKVRKRWREGSGGGETEGAIGEQRGSFNWSLYPQIHHYFIRCLTFVRLTYIRPLQLFDTAKD